MYAMLLMLQCRKNTALFLAALALLLHYDVPVRSTIITNGLGDDDVGCGLCSSCKSTHLITLNSNIGTQCCCRSTAVRELLYEHCYPTTAVQVVDCTCSGAVSHLVRIGGGSTVDAARITKE